MNFQTFFNRSVGLLLMVLLVFTAVAAAQMAKTNGISTVTSSRKDRPMTIAGKNNLYCAGYVQTSKLNTAPREIARAANKIVGAENEQEQFIYSQNDYLYINAGSNKGVQVGDMFTVIRPRGQVESRWTKKNTLGVYVQEVGALEIIKVKAEVSVARVKTSCDNILLGDLVQPVQERTSPMFVKRPALDVFGEPSGKASGRIFMARDGHEMLGREQIVYIDLGAEDNVSVGDYLTIYRPLGKGNLFISDEDETVSARDEGFQSDVYRGGKFSNQAARKYGSEADRRVVNTENAKGYRPKDLRKVVGEMVILNVKERTATAVIVRTAQEIHTGDWVEVQ